MKPKYNTPKSRVINCGTSLITVITLCFSGSAMAADDAWTGTTSNDWTIGTNWSAGHTPDRTAGEDALINTLTNFPVITASGFGPRTPRDIFVARGASTVGRLDQNAGSVANIGGNWIFVGVEGGTGTFNLTGTGSLNDSGRLWVGGSQNAGGGTGTATIDTTGILTTNDFAVGSSGGTGTVTLTSGTINTNGWNFIGKQEAAPGGNGTLNINGGIMNNVGTRTFVGLKNATGQFNISAGTYNNTTGNADTWFAIGVLNTTNSTVPTVNMTGGTINAAGLFTVGGASEHGNADVNNQGPGNGTLNLISGSPAVNVTGELWVGQAVGSTGIVNVAAGSISVNNWLAIGRHGTGTVNLSGGTITKTGGGSVSIANFDAASGTVNVSGGLFDVQSGNLIIGEGGSGTSALTLSGTGQIKAPQVLVATGGTVVSTVSFNGGTLTTGNINGAGGGTSNVSFNGTQIVATVDQPNFIANIDNATIDAGGLKIDSATKILTVPQAFTGSGPIVKSGAGIVNMPGVNATYTGNVTVSAGKLAFNTSTASLSGNLTVSNNATLGVTQTTLDEQLTFNTGTFGSAGPTALDINLGNFSPNTAFAPAKFNTITLNGTVTINITDALPETGSVPLLQYNTKTGTGTFTLGTLPLGVVANLDTSTPGLVALNVTSVKLPRWTGAVNGIWDFTTQNWVDLASGSPTTYSDQSPPLFDDNATGTTDVLLNTIVTPGLVTFANSLLNYTLTGTGKITGTTGLTKTGTGSVTIGTVNDYTGVTRLEGGTTSIALLTNGGIASGIGKATSAPSNLVLAGGVLAYTGAATSTDRGITISGVGSGINNTNDIVASGPITSTAGGLVKTGPGKLTLTSTGTNTIGLLAGIGLRADGGILQFEGGGTQVDNVAGDFFIASIPNIPASVVLNNATLNVGAYLAIGRGNGDTGTVSSFTANGSTLKTGNFSTGFDAGLLLQNSVQNVTLTNTNWTNNGITVLSESAGSTTNVVFGGTSQVTVKDRFLLGNTNNTVANLTIQDSAGLVQTNGWFSIGNNGSGIGTVIVKNSGSLTSNGDLNVSDVGTSQGTLTIQDTATVVSTGTLFIAKNPGTVGTVNLNGGTVTARRIVKNAGTGVGTLNLNGGVLVAGPAVNNPFITGLDSVVIKAGGGTIDTGSNANVTVNQFFTDDATGGTLKKIGTGTLFMNGFSNYTGNTLVNAGTLAGTGTIGGAVKIAAGANINPGATNGTLFVDSLAFTGAGTLTIDIGANADTLSVTNALNLTNASLVLNGTPTLPSYIIASYGTLVGTFPAVTLPAGYSIVYNFNGNNQIAIVGSATPFQTYIGSFYPGETNPAIVGLKADPDSDGLSNLVEFALDGNPTSGVRSGKVVVKTASVGGVQTLVLTLPVRTGATFAGATEQVGSASGITYHIQGSTDLVTWNLAVSEVTGADKTAIESGLPALSDPTMWTYRTFRASAPIAGNPKSFLRAVIESQ